MTTDIKSLKQRSTTNLIHKEMTQCIILVLPDLIGLYQLAACPFLPVFARPLLELCYTQSYCLVLRSLTSPAMSCHLLLLTHTPISLQSIGLQPRCSVNTYAKQRTRCCDCWQSLVCCSKLSGTIQTLPLISGNLTCNVSKLSPAWI